MKLNIFFLKIFFFIGFYGLSQVGPTGKNENFVFAVNDSINENRVDCPNNNGLFITVTSTTTTLINNSPTVNTNCSPSARLNVPPGTQLNWNGPGGGFLTYEFSQPLIQARITYSAVNGPLAPEGIDIASLTIDGGGTLILSDPCGVDLMGNILTCNIDGDVNPFGEVAITVSSDCPFTFIRLQGETVATGWVQGNACNFELIPYNCSDIVPNLNMSSVVIECPENTFDLSEIFANNLLCNTVLTWHTSSLASDFNQISSPLLVGEGIYYASLYNTLLNCYSNTIQFQVFQNPCCLPTLNSSMNINTRVREERSDYIISADVITYNDPVIVGNGVVYHAGNFVELVPGFEAITGSQFSAYVRECTGNFVYKVNDVKNDVVENEIDRIVEEKDDEIEVYPNPSNGLVYIDVNSLSISNIIINSIDGKVYGLNFEKSEHLLTIDISNFSQGIYMLNVFTNEGEIINKKIIKR